MKVVFSWSSSAIFIWLYPENASMNIRSLYPVVESISRSSLGRGKLSFMQALFRLWSLCISLIFHLPSLPGQCWLANLGNRPHRWTTLLAICWPRPWLPGFILEQRPIVSRRASSWDLHLACVGWSLWICLAYPRDSMRKCPSCSWGIGLVSPSFLGSKSSLPL